MEGDCGGTAAAGGGATGSKFGGGASGSIFTYSTIMVKKRVKILKRKSKSC